MYTQQLYPIGIILQEVEISVLVSIIAPPELFAKHVSYILETIRPKKIDNQVVFLKSWNEWGEGNYMEPDMKYGDGYIRTLYQCLELGK